MDVRALNADMVTRLLATPGAALADGQYALRVLETHGRRSGERRLVPIAVVRRDSRHFLVSPVRDRDWVRNLVADPSCALLAGAARSECRAQPVTDRPAAEVVAQYLHSMTAPWAIRAFSVRQDATVEEIGRHVDRMAVFELVDQR